jgi:Putative DNA-binding domain
MDEQPELHSSDDSAAFSRPTEEVMPLFHKPIESLSEDDLLALIANAVPEGKGIDYKRDQIGSSDGDKRELLYDVSSFANSSGGHLVIGMDENAGVPTHLPGLSGDPDAEVIRIETNNTGWPSSIDPGPQVCRGQVGRCEIHHYR